LLSGLMAGGAYRSVARASFSSSVRKGSPALGGRAGLGRGIRLGGFEDGLDAENIAGTRCFCNRALVVITKGGRRSRQGRGAWDANRDRELVWACAVVAADRLRDWGAFRLKRRPRPAAAPRGAINGLPGRVRRRLQEVRPGQATRFSRIELHSSAAQIRPRKEFQNCRS
jgi:hypothetical protein